MRVLHLLDAASPQASSATLALLADGLGRLEGVAEEVLLLGGTDLQRQAEAAGLRGATVLSVPQGQALWGWPAVRHWAARQAFPPTLSDFSNPQSAIRNPESGPFSLIHCWSLGALSLATLLFRATPRVLSVTVPPTPRALHWLRLLVGDGGAAPGAGAGGVPGGRTVVLPISATIRRALLSAGLPEPAVHVLRPGIDLARLVPATRRALRESWGIEEEENVKVVALLSDPPQIADAIAAVMAVGLAGEVVESARSLSPRQRVAASAPPGAGMDARSDDPSGRLCPHPSPLRGGEGARPLLRLLVHPAQRNRQRAQGLLRHVRRAHRLILDERVAQPWAVLPGCDFALVLGAAAPPGGYGRIPDYAPADGPAGGGLSLLWAMAGNAPIVAESTYAVSEIVEDHHSALLARPGQPKTLSDRFTTLLADPRLAWQLRDTARSEAFSLFSRQRYCEALGAVYQQMMEGRAVEVPPPPMTGGLRFAGR